MIGLMLRDARGKILQRQLDGASRAIERLLSDQALHRRAAELGGRIAAEDGAGGACDEIEAFLTRG